MENTSNPETKPYFMRAIHEWCTDYGFTPYLAVLVNGRVDVPMQYVHNGQIILNVSHVSTQGLEMGNDAITFKARFNGVPRDIYVPIENVIAIYARENGEGMVFEAVKSEDKKYAPPVQKQPELRSVPKKPTQESTDNTVKGPDDTPPTTPKGGKPILTRIK